MQDHEASGGVMADRGLEESTWEREDTMRAPIPSCLGMKVCGLVV